MNINYTIRKKLIVMLGMSAAVALFISSITMNYFTFITEKQESLINLQSLASITSENIRAALAFEDKVSARKMLEPLRMNGDIVGAVILREDGEMFTSFFPGHVTTGQREEVVAEMKGLINRSHENISTNRKSIQSVDWQKMYVVEPILLNNDILGMFCVISQSTQLQNRITYNIAIQLVVIAVTLIIIFLMSIRLQRLFTAPIYELLRVMDLVTKKKNYTVCASTKQNDEFKELYAGFNAMIEEVRDRDAKLDAYSRNMSHELRTPLNAILGFSELMTRDTSLSDEQCNNLNIINRSGEHLLSLINNVLELSKIEAGKLDMQQEDFDLHNLLIGLEEMFRLRAGQKGLNLDVEMVTDVPQYVRADQGKLRQILINLLGNAVKFTGKDGTITLRLSRCYNEDSQRREAHISPKAQPSIVHSCMLLIEVIDTGTGIAGNELARVFSPFFQTDTGQAQQGTGLGLSLSMGFAKVMGGDLSAKSELGNGSVFTLKVPVDIIDGSAFTVSSQASRVVGLEPSQQPFRILVVDDDMASRNLLVKLLETVGFQVQSVVNGRQAVDLWEKWKPHLIWMDFKMPVMDGHEATSLIKNRPAGKETKIIALTASAFEEDRLMSLAQGCDDFLRKPFREIEIFNVLSKQLGVKYIYGEENKQCLPAAEKEMAIEGATSAVATLSVEILTKLTEATELSDVTMIGQIIEDISHENKQLGNVLSDLADNFAYDEILTIIQIGKRRLRLKTSKFQGKII